MAFTLPLKEGASSIPSHLFLAKLLLSIFLPECRLFWGLIIFRLIFFLSSNCSDSFSLGLGSHLPTAVFALVLLMGSP